MLFPNKVKYRKWQTGRKNPKKLAVKIETRGTELSFGEYGLKAVSQYRIKSNQLESARKAIKRHIGKEGKMCIRVFPDRPVTRKAAEVGMGKGKGDPDHFCIEVFIGRILFEVSGVSEEVAREALRKGGTKLPVKVKIVKKR
ncbi:MAG: 50S ribosomal protein L16 [Candidatus Pacebacteria bacterium]|nr:50S ribosomal protein L16 [Candidatus Paceibacterota bacterium]